MISETGGMRTIQKTISTLSLFEFQLCFGNLTRIRQKEALNKTIFLDDPHRSIEVSEKILDHSYNLLQSVVKAMRASKPNEKKKLYPISTILSAAVQNDYLLFGHERYRVRCFLDDSEAHKIGLIEPDNNFKYLISGEVDLAIFREISHSSQKQSPVLVEIKNTDIYKGISQNCFYLYALSRQLNMPFTHGIATNLSSWYFIEYSRASNEFELSRAMYYKRNDPEGLKELIQMITYFCRYSYDLTQKTSSLESTETKADHDPNTKQ